MDMKVDKVRNILVNLDDISDKLNDIPQSYLSIHIEDKLELVEDLILDLEEYFENRLSELEIKTINNNTSN